MANSYFNVGDEERLIELVRAYPALYNWQNSSYKNFSAKAIAWKEISEKINKTEDACKAKWKHIRDWYIRKKKAGKLPVGSGSFINHLRLRYDKLEFLRKSEKTTEIFHNFSETIKEEQIETQDDVPLLALEGSESESPVTQPKKNLKVPKLRIPKRKLKSTLTQILPNYTRTARKILEDKRGELKRRRIEDSDGEEITQSVSLTTPKHPIDEFFGAMASIVKQLPANVQVQVKQEVSQIILKAESRVVSSQDTMSLLSTASNTLSSLSNSSKED